MDAKTASRKIYELMTSGVDGPVPAMRTWDGETWGPPDARATIVLQHPGALRALLWPPNDLTAGEAYVFDDVDVEGDMIWATASGAAAAGRLGGPLTGLRALSYLRALPAESRRAAATRPELAGRRHSKRRDRSAIRHHYDTGNEFYELFLGEEMVYSCAYFLTPDDTLDEAQGRKLDLVLRKLRLQPGQRFLDIGCGWGSLVIRAAREYGVEATGSTLSAAQAEYARRRVKELDLEDRVTIVEQDYRDLDGTFDAIASVGMFEHVGRAQLVPYFEQLRSLLAPGGAVLNHGISERNRAAPGFRLPRRSQPTFVGTYVFPDGELVPVERTIEIAERAGFEVRDAEALRMNYALTLRKWVANLERNRRKALTVASEETYRIWRAYMSGAVVAFEAAAFGVYQLLCVDPAAPWRHGRSWAIAADDA